jgi:hypothetical protein
VNQILSIDFSTAKLKTDKMHHFEHNIEFSARCIYIELEDDIYRDCNVVVLFPKISFLRMLKKDLNPEEIKVLFVKQGNIQIDVIKENDKKYILKNSELKKLAKGFLGG